MGALLPASLGAFPIDVHVFKTKQMMRLIMRESHIQSRLTDATHHVSSAYLAMTYRIPEASRWTGERIGSMRDNGLVIVAD